MTPELAALAAAVLLQMATLVLMAMLANAELGHSVTLSPRDGPMPQVSPRLGRLMRSLTNGVEGLALFTPAVLIVTLAGQSDGVTQTAAWAYVAARALYLPAYVFGWVPWRSAIWGLGFTATLILLVSALI